MVSGEEISVKSIDNEGYLLKKAQKINE